MIMVRKERLELSRVAPLEPKSSASTNSATFAIRLDYQSVTQSCKDSDESLAINLVSTIHGVNDGIRTHDNRDHNPGLYQLSYAHHNLLTRNLAFGHLWAGAPGRIRTCYPRLRRPMLYPDELRALNWSGWRDSNSRHPAPKAGALPDCATPRYPSRGQCAHDTNGDNLGQQKNNIFFNYFKLFVIS